MDIELWNLIISPVLTMNCKLLVLETEVNVILMYIAHLIYDADIAITIITSVWTTGLSTDHNRPGNIYTRGTIVVGHFKM